MSTMWAAGRYIDMGEGVLTVAEFSNSNSDTAVAQGLAHLRNIGLAAPAVVQAVGR